MPKTSQRAESIPVPVIRHQLEAAKESLENAFRMLEYLESQNLPAINSFGKPALETAVQKMRSFTIAIDSAIYKHKLGIIIEVGARKSRSKDAPPVAEIKTNLDAKRKTAKKKRLS
jgi:hypothetical protein